MILLRRNSFPNGFPSRPPEAALSQSHENETIEAQFRLVPGSEWDNEEPFVTYIFFCISIIFFTSSLVSTVPFAILSHNPFGMYT